MVYSKKKINIIIIFSCLFFAFFIRAYNIGYDNLWFDEISSFWVSDPRISLEESLTRHNNIEKTPFLYFSILKINFQLFSYDSIIGRYLSLFFNILGIIFSVLICRLIKKNSAYILALFIFSTNIFLINYSQELRVYSLVFFLSSIYLYLFLKINNFSNNQKFDKFYFILISLILTLLLISHQFSLIIFFSTAIFLCFKYLFKKPNSKTLIYNFYFGAFFSLIYIFFSIKNFGSSPSWIVQPDLKFYTNFYFSKFFGSRIMGLIHLVLLLTLILTIFRNNIKKNFDLNVFLIIIFLSYFLPLIFGYLIKPIIFPRYIIFVLIPIIILLSILVFEIKNSLIRNFVILLLITINIGNHFFEASFQQFYKERPFFKPNFNKMINTIKMSETKLYTLQLSYAKDNNEYYYDAIENYISNFQAYKNSNIKYLDQKKFLNSDFKEIWVICLINIVKDKCKKIKLKHNDKILSEKSISGMRMTLILKDS